MKTISKVFSFCAHRGGVWCSRHLPGLCRVQAGPQVRRGCSELLQSRQGCLHWGDQVRHVSIRGKQEFDEAHVNTDR